MGLGEVEDVQIRFFIVRQICEKYLGKGKDVYFVFLDLEKAYDRVDRCNVECFEIIWNWR